MATKLQIRRDTAANWTSANPTLSAGEFGFETDTYKLKIGDGSTAWTSLDYYADQLVSAGGVDSAGIISLLGNGSVQHIIPAGNELYDLGDSANRFRDLYLSGSTLNLGGVTLSVDSGGTLTLPEGTRVGTIRVLDSADVATIAGGLSGLDSTGVQNLIDAAYIQANQITYNTSDFADSAFVTSQINNLIDGAPGTLDTLNEIAAALNDDDSAYNTLLSLINAKTDYDSADTLGLIDSAYIQLRRPAETIMTVTGDGANYYFTGDGFPSTSSGDPTLYLTRGKTYQFEGISGSHPFEIRQSAGGSAYSTGVTNNGGSGTVIFTVPMDAPASLVYQCTVHSGMVGDIVILDNSAGSGVDSAAVTALIDSAYIQARQTSGGSGTVDSAQVISIINNNTNSGFVWYSYTATQGQTTFQDSDNSGKILSYDPDGIAVFYNGVLLTPNDFTASDQSSVVLGTAADSGENIAIFKWGVGYTPPPYPWGGDRGLTGGGNIASTSPYHSNVIDYFDITTASNAVDFGDLNQITQDATGVSNGTRAVFMGGGAGDGSGSLNYSNTMEYVTIASPSNATDFGDLTLSVTYTTGDNKADGTYGLVSGFRTASGNVNNIEYITIASTSNTTDFGDLTQARTNSAACSDGTYAIMTGGMDASSNLFNIIDYVTIASPSNATDFGDLVEARVNQAAVSSTTIGLIGAGRNSSYDLPLAMEYVMIATPGNASAAGDLFNASNSYAAGASSNGTYGTWNGGGYISDTIQRVTISTSGNASDFADLTVGRSNGAGTSGNAA